VNVFVAEESQVFLDGCWDFKAFLRVLAEITKVFEGCLSEGDSPRMDRSPAALAAIIELIR